jgi:hypothetical protein
VRTIHLALLCLVGFGTAWAQSQSASQIQGIVQDASGSAVAGADVKATQTDTGAVRITISGADGSYVLANLPIGPYRLEVSKTGFSTFVQSGIVLQVSTNPTVDVLMKVGAVSEQVQVEANTTLVETQATGIGALIENRRIVELPLNGRVATDLIQMAGGVIPQGVAGNGGYPGTPQFVINGGQAFGVAFWLDGSVYNNPWDLANLPFPFPDALQEFKVESSSLTAQNGVHAGGTVTGITKSGTNGFHGDLFDFVRNGDLNGRNFLQPTRDTLKRNQFGGTLGGPIKRDKLFFFFGFQNTLTRQDPAANLAATFVPTAAMRAGDFSACPADIPAALASQFPNNKISPTLFDPASLKLAALLPVSNAPCGNTSFGLTTQVNEDQYVGRGDYQTSSKNSLFGRYLRSHYIRPPSYNFTPTNILSTAQGGLDDADQSYTFGDTYLFSPTLVSQFRASVNRVGIHRFNTDYVDACDVGVPVYCGYTPHQSGFTVTGGFTIGAGTGGQAVAHSTIFQLNDDISWVRGSHQINFGVGGVMSKMLFYGNVYSQTNWTFPNLAQFLLGQFSSNSMSLPNDLLQQKWFVNSYIQDTWKVNPRLTVNVGLRWEPFLPPSEINGSVYNFSLANMIAGVKSTQFVNAPPGLSFPGDPGFQGKTGENKQWLLFAPRVALAYDPTGAGKMTIRASYGISYDYVSGELMVNSADAPPYGGTEIWSGKFSDPFASNPGGNIYPYAVNANAPFAPGGTYIYLPPNLKTTAVNQWNMVIQRQLGKDWMVSASYAGSESSHLWLSKQDNPAVVLPCPNGVVTSCNTTANQNSRRLFTVNKYPGNAAYGFVEALDDGGTSSYNGLILSVQKRLSKGLSASANFTWSHCIGDLSIGDSTGNAGAGLAIPNNRRFDRGNCQSNEIGGTFSSDRRKIFNWTTVYETPKLANARLSMLASGWKVAGIYHANSAPWITASISTDLSLTSDSTANQRPIQLLANPLCANPRPTCWLNPAAFANPAPGTLSPMGRDNIPGPATWGLDTAVSRDFRIREGQILQIRAEAFNVTNSFRAGTSPPALSAGASGVSTVLGTPTFGTITTALDPRIVQLALKFSF